MAFERILYDVEGNGLLPVHVDPPFCMDRLHSLGIKCLDTGQKRSFVNDDLFPLSAEDIAELDGYGHFNVEPLSVGLEVMENATYRTGHNIIDFDEEAVRLVKPTFKSDARICDTLVMARMCFADIKESDFRMLAKGKLEGKLIGRQGLEAWGQRLGLHKGDYKAEREEDLKQKHKDAGLPPPTAEELHYHVWGRWNPKMHDYMMLDIDVNFLLWEKIEEMRWSREATVMEHRIHELMVRQERNGFQFNVHSGRALETHLRVEYDRLSAEAIDSIGKWYRPCRAFFDVANAAFGEHGDRRSWGEVTIPKRTANYAKSNAVALADGKTNAIRADVYEGVPFVKVELREFNPNSRPQIIDRLQTLYGWEPQDFTENNSPRVDDEVLRTLSSTVPIAETLAEVFYIKKRLGQVADGENGWLKLVRADGRIHGRVNVGGTVSGRATHARPNVSQVPGVNPKEFKDREKYQAYIDKWCDQFDFLDRPMIVSAKWNEKKGEGKIYMRGREGGYGWDCRELFTVPPGYVLVGCDLSGIEFRCLANLTFQFDKGEIVDIVLNGDIHQKNADLTGIPRGLAKRLLYACLYGGGDAKLGSIIEPFASEARQKTIGKQAREKLMRAMPSLNLAIKQIKREKRMNNGTIAGLDGRRLYVRSDHAALNLRLQSDGALIAKKWCLLVDDLFYEEGWDHGDGLDYMFCSWSHDEIQVAVREDLAERAGLIMEQAAVLAGEHFKLNCPVAAEHKIGRNWSETH
jgi:DNA polymerase family A